MSPDLPQTSFISSEPVDECGAILSWLRHLARLFPASHTVLVGAGHGAGPWIDFLQTSRTDHVTLVEADESCFRHLQRNTSRQQQWTLCRELLSPSGGRVCFHRMSVASENGLLHAERLTALWPRLVPVDATECDSLSLRQLLDRIPSIVNWLIIDCHPSVSILQGVGPYIDQIDVVLLRLTNSPDAIPVADCSLESAIRELDSLDLEFVAYESSRNPKSGHALFIRSPVRMKKALERLAEHLSQCNEQLAARKAQQAEQAREEPPQDLETVHAPGIHVDSLEQQPAPPGQASRTKAGHAEAMENKIRLVAMESVLDQMQRLVDGTSHQLTGQHRTVQLCQSQLDLLGEFLRHPKPKR